MRVLIVTPEDPSGALYWLCHRLRTENVADARLVTLGEPTSAYGWTDLAQVYDGGRELLSLIEAADVIHLVDLHPRDLPMLEYASGQVRWIIHDDHAQPDASAASGRSLGQDANVAVVSSYPATESSTVQWMPPFVPFGVPPWVPLAKGSRARSRTNHIHVMAWSARPLRDTPRLEAMIEELEGWRSSATPIRLEVCCGRPHRWALARARRVHLVVTDGLGALPRCAIDALSVGTPVACPLDASVVAAYKHLVRQPPPVLGFGELTRHLARRTPMDDANEDLLRWSRAAFDPAPWFELYRSLNSSRVSARSRSRSSSLSSASQPA